MKSFSKFLSIVFHPVFLPTYMGLIILFGNPILFSQHRGLLLLMLVILTIGFPLISIVLMKWLDLIDSFEMKDAKERFVPLIAVTTFWLWAFFMFKPGTPAITSSNALLSNMLLGCVISMFLVFPLNSMVKISFHAIGMGGLVGLLINLIPLSDYNLTWLFILAVILAGLVGSARLILKAHNLTEVAIGFFLGFTGQFIAYQFYDRFAGLLNF